MKRKIGQSEQPQSKALTLTASQNSVEYESQTLQRNEIILQQRAIFPPHLVMLLLSVCNNTVGKLLTCVSKLWRNVIIENTTKLSSFGLKAHSFSHLYLYKRLSSAKIPKVSANLLLELLRFCPLLTHLQVMYRPQNMLDDFPLIQTAELHQCLTELHLVGPTDITLAHLLQLFPNLKNLTISQSSLTQAGLNMISAKTTIESISFRHGELSHPSMSDPLFYCIKSLDIFFRADDEHMSSYSGPPPSLDYFVVRQSFTKRSEELILQYLETCKHIRFIRLLLVLPDNVYTSLAFHLKYLQLLEIWGEGISDNSLMLINDKCKFLTHVALFHCPSLTSVALSSLANCTYLFDLEMNDIPQLSDEVIDKISSSCQYLSNFKLLRNPSITLQSALLLVKKCKNLRELRVRECKLITSSALKNEIQRLDSRCVRIYT
eukprot:TRINITY_DN4046_c0_g1_i1.p1 TRINITY_DN4046_c0_g1~~TRINITY_DN4046_c0_g1_i1.p1  ORF type:complete len:433 (-),score=72.61 TRINITY_DN4046_c0_g1_i1:42-1340(-)